MPDTPSLLTLLFPAARASLRPEHAGLLARNLRMVSDWPALLACAEEQGLAPLLYQHARTAGVDLPEDARRQLGGSAMRQRLAAQARAQALEEIQAAAQPAGLEVLVVRGAAAALLAYPLPGLRPGSLDLLAGPGQARKLQELLARLGFQGDDSPLMGMGLRHLPVMVRQGSYTRDTGPAPDTASARESSFAPELDGAPVTVQVHRELFDPHWRGRSPTVTDLLARSRELRGGAALVRVPAIEDLLWDIYQHLVNTGLRLVAVADLVSLAEQFVTEIDWRRLRRARPALVHALALFHAVAPLSGGLVERAGLPAGPHPPGSRPEVENFAGWPGARSLPAALNPPDFWLRLYFGLAPGAPLGLTRWLRFPLEIGRLAWRHAMRKE